MLYHGLTLAPADDGTPLLTPADVVDRLRRRGRRRLDLGTVYRWLTRGVSVPHVGRIVLPSIADGTRRLIHPQWLAAFLAVRSGGDAVRVEPRETARQSTAGHRRAVERLKKLGVA